MQKYNINKKKTCPNTYKQQQSQQISNSHIIPVQKGENNQYFNFLLQEKLPSNYQQQNVIFKQKELQNISEQKLIQKQACPSSQQVTLILVLRKLLKNITSLQINKQKILTGIIAIFTIIFLLVLTELYINTFSETLLLQQKTIRTLQSTKQTKKIFLKNKLKDISFSIKYPEQNVKYRIFSGMDPSLVANIHQYDPPQNHLVVSNLMDIQNQIFYFKHIQNNKYKIFNIQMNKVMKVQERNNKFPWMKIVFQQQSDSRDQVWELIPANFTANDCFYIRSVSGMYLHIKGQYFYHEHSLIVTNFKQQNFDRFQKWVIKPVLKSNNQFNLQNYQKKAAQIFWKYNLVQEQYVQWLQFYQFKHDNQLALPFWLKKLYIQTKKNDLPEFDQEIKQKKIPYSQFPSSLFFQCPKKHIVAYIWYGNKQMPKEYKHLLLTCNETTKLLTQKDFLKYSEMWNQISEYKINSQEVKLRQQFDLLKLLYLYFESGIYSDFDTQINEECFSQVYADEIIFTNYWSFQYNSIVLPEENFLMVRRKHHPQIKRMLEQELMRKDRWAQCRNRQCFILLCQRHFAEKSYTKGYD